MIDALKRLSEESPPIEVEWAADSVRVSAGVDTLLDVWTFEWPAVVFGLCFPAMAAAAAFLERSAGGGVACGDFGLRSSVRFESTPGRIRTCDRRLRRPLLYPTELRALIDRLGAGGQRSAEGESAGVDPLQLPRDRPPRRLIYSANAPGCQVRGLRIRLHAWIVIHTLDGRSCWESVSKKRISF